MNKSIAKCPHQLSSVLDLISFIDAVRYTDLCMCRVPLLGGVVYAKKALVRGSSSQTSQMLTGTLYVPKPQTIVLRSQKSLYEGRNLLVLRLIQSLNRQPKAKRMIEEARL